MSQPSTLGDYLRAVRRERKVSIERAAEETRIRADFLMRMESDEFDFLAPAYVRGFLRTYARFLDVSPGPLIEEFDRRFGGVGADPRQIVVERGRAAPRERRKLPRWAALAIALLGVIGLLALVGVLVSPDDDDGRKARVATTDEPSASPTPTESEEPSPSPTPSESPSPSAVPLDSELAFADGIDVEITAATARCWVLVAADGVELYRDIIEVGETQSFSAEEEMEIVLGAPSGIEFVVNGQDLGPPPFDDARSLRLPDDIDALL
ncbi:MAG: DUF4115 domain-containing protein [Actinomycetota bacterium]|nr:DUF4115 domain-containing protein [Actinomycetota bacterium]